MYRFVIHLSLLSGLLLVLIAFSLPTSAASRSVILERRDGDITVLENGDIDVIETWEVRFNGGPFQHGYRTIPLKTGSAATNWQVREGGRGYQQSTGHRPGTFDVVSQDEEVTLDWYFSPTSNAVRTFELHYRLQGALRIYPDGDQVWLKFIESGREYPINAARVVVHLPREFAAEQLKAATYLNRVENQSGRIRDGQTVVFNGGPFQAHDEWEIRAQFPHGAVTASPPPWQFITDQQPIYNMISLVSALIILVVGFATVYLCWDLFGRDQRVGKVARFYNRPPDDTPPGMVGILIDEKADLRDIIATIIDLARRGFIRITELKSTGSLGVTDTAFVRTGIDESSLRPYERNLLGCMFGVNTEQYLSDLRNTFYEKIPYLKHSLYDEALQQGYFKHNPQSVRITFAIIGLVLVILTSVAGVIGYARVADYAPYSFVAFGSAVLVALGFLAISPFMPRKTSKGAMQVARWRAFKRYLEHIDRYTRVADVKQYFDLYLPYALAFGFEREFVRTFAAVDTPVPAWYQPNPVLLVGVHNMRHHHNHFDTSHGMPSGGAALPAVDSIAHGFTTSLDAVCNDFFSMLDATASALTFQQGAFGTAEGSSFADWLSSGGDSGGWSGGGSFGGGGFGGGASGFN